MLFLKSYLCSVSVRPLRTVAYCTLASVSAFRIFSWAARFWSMYTFTCSYFLSCSSNSFYEGKVSKVKTTMHNDRFLIQSLKKRSATVIKAHTFMSARSVVTRAVVMSSCWIRSLSCFSRELRWSRISCTLLRILFIVWRPAISSENLKNYNSHKHT